MKILTPRNCNLLFDIHRFRYMTTEQVRTLHFAHLKEHSEAPRVLLYRLNASQVLSKAATYAQSQTSSDGLTITKPRPVWYLSKANLKRMVKARPELAERFEKISQPSQKLSDQSLPHEIGLTTILMAFEQAALQSDELIDFSFLRTSPRHPLTSTIVRVGNTKQTINPDAVIFFRRRTNTATYPYFFYIEYERGTATAKRYLKEKINPYTRYFHGACKPSIYGKRSFADVVKDFSEIFSLNLKHPERLLFRVLTITGTSHHKLALSKLVLNQHPPGVFLFADLDTFCADPFATIWHTKNSVVAIP